MNVYEAVDSILEHSWNLTKVKPLIDDLDGLIQKTDSSTTTIPSNFSDWKNIRYFFGLHKLKKQDWFKMDWSTEAVGSIFMKPLKNIKKRCRDELIPLVNDLFTLPKQGIPLPDIALAYSAMDFRILGTENHFKDSQELDNSLKACIEDVNSITFDNEATLDKYIDIQTVDSAKYMDPSPCLNLKKFSKCTHYCMWHKNFFQDIPRTEFLTIMKYALLQRKIRLVYACLTT